MKKGKRVMVVSDPAFPLATSGFSMAVRPIIDGLVSAGFDVFHLARGTQINEKDFPEEFKANGVKVISCPPDDINGYRYIARCATAFQVDAIFYEADPHSVNGYQTNTEVRSIPTVVHGPIEGAPFLKPDSTCYSQIVSTGGIITTYTEFGRKAICEGIHKSFAPGSDMEFEVGVIGLGIEHGNFRILPQKERDAIRNKLGWNGRKVLINVARNNGRKMWPRLFKTVSILKEIYPEILLYAHCVPFENYALGGHDLTQIADEMGILDNVMFPQMIWDAFHGTKIDDLVGLYNAADAFVCMSGAEGWCIPATEAAACGKPVFATEYSGVWEIVKDFGVPLTPVTYDTFPNGTELAMVDPETAANKLLHYFDRPESMDSSILRGLEIIKGYTWNNLRRAAPELVDRALSNTVASSKIITPDRIGIFANRR